MMLFGEGNDSSILFSKYVEMMKLPQDVITTDIKDVYIFIGNKSCSLGCVSFNVIHKGKALIVDFLLIDYKSPYTTILGRN